MKILVAQFVTESNANVPNMCQLEDYDLAYHHDCIKQMRIGDVFEDAGIEVVPSIYANACAAGIVTKNAFDYIESRILTDIKENLNDLDGIYLMLHGASEVDDLEGGSGDHHILREVRKIVGPYFPIAVVCDPHGNLSKEHVENATIIRCYRESPHTDTFETMRLVAKMLVDLLENRQMITPVYRKLPLILGGEQSVSTDEPVRSINQYLDQLERDERLLSCSWHVGYIRHDTDVAGCGVVVVPSSHAHQDYANEIADQLATFVWERRHDFHYTGLTAQPEEALQMALDYQDKPVFITDSGDNVTSGATGWNTFILRQVLAAREQTKKSFLFASITDYKTFLQLDRCEIGDVVEIALGTGYDRLSEAVNLSVTVKAKGELESFLGYNEDVIYGHCVTVSLSDHPIDIVVASTNQTFAEEHQFVAAGLDWDDYDVIVIKQGYSFPEIKEKGKLNVMSLTQGATPQDTASIPFKRVMRPIFPLDDI